MQFSDSTNKTGLVEDTDFLCGTNSTSYPTADKTRSINRWYYDAVINAWKADGDWEFDDLNQTGFPISTTTLVNSQADYTIPTNALKIKRMEVLDVNGIWHQLESLDESDVEGALDEFEKIDGLPRFYRLTRRNIILYPAPDNGVSVTLASGLKVYHLREVDEFTASDTTQEPGIAEPFHRILSLGAAYDWMIVNGTADKATNIRAEMERLMLQLRDFYSSRHENYKLGFKASPYKDQRQYR